MHIRKLKFLYNVSYNIFQEVSPRPSSTPVLKEKQNSEVIILIQP